MERDLAIAAPPILMGQDGSPHTDGAEQPASIALAAADGSQGLPDFPGNIEGAGALPAEVGERAAQAVAPVGELATQAAAGPDRGANFMSRFIPGRKALARLAIVTTGALGGSAVLANTASGSATSAPDAFAVVSSLQQDVWYRAQPLQDCTQLPPPQQPNCEKLEFSEPRDAVKDIQSSYPREIVDRLSVVQKLGSRKVKITLRQKDMMAVSTLGLKYREETYPGATPDIPPVTVKHPTRFFNYLISPDIVNKFTLKVRAGYMTAKGKCKSLGKLVTLPKFDNYGAAALPKDKIEIGDRVGAYTAKDTTETFVASHTSVAHAKQRRGLTSSQRRKGSCVEVHQTSSSRNPSQYGNLRERARFMWGRFTKRSQSRKSPKTARIKQT